MLFTKRCQCQKTESIDILQLNALLYEKRLLEPPPL